MDEPQETSSLLAIAPLALLVLACGPSNDDATRAMTMSASSRPQAAKPRYTDEGKVCLKIDTKVAPAEATDSRGASFLIAGAPLIISVHAPQDMPTRACLQTGSSCQVKVDGTTLQIHSLLRFDLTGALDCIATSTAEVVCDGPPLTDGQYVVQHGSTRSSFQVPITTPLPFCIPPAM